MHRRKFLGRCLITPLILPLTTRSAFSANKSSEVAYLAAAQSNLGEHSIVAMNRIGEMLIEHSIPSRGHSFASSNNGMTAVIARRPADFCLILDRNAHLVEEIQATENRHFYGHGVFDPSGEYLYLTENDYSNNRGVIGVYRVSDSFQRVAEFSSFGVGPHEICLNQDVSQLVVANGGIETHPASGRKKLNLNTMQPSLAFIDRNTGKLLSSAALSEQAHSNSIRHMSVGADNTVYLAMQNQSPHKPSVLIAKARFGNPIIEKLQLPPSMEDLLDNYVGDIALDHSQKFLAASSPSGNTLLVQKLDDGQVAATKIADVCAIKQTSTAGEFISSSGDGRMFRLICRVNSNSKLLIEKSVIADFAGQLHWDNHLSVSI